MYLSSGFSWQDAVRIGSSNVIEDRRSKELADNEFVNHAIQIEANLKTGMYQYGTVHLGMLTHWIPRAIWPGKPQRSMGLYPLARDHYKPGFYTNLGHGGAWGPVADSFDNYWYYCIVFWYLIGWGAVALYRPRSGARAIELEDALPRRANVGPLALRPVPVRGPSAIHVLPGRVLGRLPLHAAAHPVPWVGGHPVSGSARVS